MRPESNRRRGKETGLVDVGQLVFLVTEVPRERLMRLGGTGGVRLWAVTNLRHGVSNTTHGTRSTVRVTESVVFRRTLTPRYRLGGSQRDSWTGSRPVCHR